MTSLCALRECRCEFTGASGECAANAARRTQAATKRAGASHSLPSASLSSVPWAKVLASSALFALLNAQKPSPNMLVCPCSTALKTLPYRHRTLHTPQQAVKAVLVLLNALQHWSHVRVRLGRASSSKGASHEPGTLSRTTDIAGGMSHARRLCNKLLQGAAERLVSVCQGILPHAWIWTWMTVLHPSATHRVAHAASRRAESSEES